jgi:hypothetical protein
MEKKICSKCKEEKEVCEFNKKLITKKGLQRYKNNCKTCQSEYNKNKINENPLIKSEYNKKWNNKNPNYYKNYYNKNIQKIKEKNALYREINSNNNKQYYLNNKEYFSNYKRKKYNNDDLFKLMSLIRNRIRGFIKLKNVIKNSPTFSVVGCSPEFLKKYLEQKFTEGMSWELMGKHIHIDHIVPLSSANTEEEIYKLCHYTNLQPLWAEDNLRKSNKIFH